jgi:hypothetical protein
MIVFLALFGASNVQADRCVSSGIGYQLSGNYVGKNIANVYSVPSFALGGAYAVNKCPGSVENVAPFTGTQATLAKPFGTHDLPTTCRRVASASSVGFDAIWPSTAARIAAGTQAG